MLSLLTVSLLALSVSSQLVQQPVVSYQLDLDEKRLVEFEGQSPVWITELEKINAKAQGVKFFDITDNQDLGSFGQRKKNTFPTSLNYTKTVKKVIKTLSTAGPKANLEKFTSFYNRCEPITYALFLNFNYPTLYFPDYKSSTKSLPRIRSRATSVLPNFPTHGVKTLSLHASMAP